MLVVEHNLLEQICNTIRDIVTPFWNTGKDSMVVNFIALSLSLSLSLSLADQCLNLHSRNYKHERIGYILCDLRYAIM